VTTPASGTGIVTGEAVALDLRPARLPSRMLAAGIDLAVQYGVLLLVVGLLVGALASSADDALLQAVVVAMVVAALLGYPVAMLTFARGRTLGKMALGLRVVRDDGGPVAFRQAFVRELVGVVVEKPGLFLFAPAVVTSLVREDGKRIGDLAAGTLVVSERVALVGRPALAAPLPMPRGLGAWAATLDLSRVPDDLALRAREFLGRADDLRPAAREAVGRSLVDAVLPLVGPPPPGTPAWAYLSAVLAERRRRDERRLAERARAAARVPGLAPGQPHAGRTVGMAAYDLPWTP